MSTATTGMPPARRRFTSSRLRASSGSLSEGDVPGAFRVGPLTEHDDGDVGRRGEAAVAG